MDALSPLSRRLILTEMARGQRTLDKRDAAPLLAEGLISELPERHCDPKCGYYALVGGGV